VIALKRYQHPMRLKTDNLLRKEVIKMAYVKPELLVLATASAAIQGGDTDTTTSKLNSFTDSRSNHSSASAYEADE
jgi:hypothetical protein